MSLFLISDKNLLKRDSSSGSAVVAAPATASGYGTFITNYTVTHNLGYIPQVRVYYENSATDGKIYPAGGYRLAGTYPGLAANSIFCLWTLDTTTLTITLESNTTKSGTGNRNVYYVIYKDFEV